jgi:mannose-6-phosphate isomerase-like protein (cupin superfamily)
MKFAIVLLLAAIASSASGQSPANAEIFSSAQIRAQFSKLAQQANATGSSGMTLRDFGTHTLMLSERTVSGRAEIHAHFDDVMMVIQGQATLITGGDVIEPHDSGNGETSGSGIRNGVAKSITAGDVIHIPAGVPHQLLVAHGVTYSAFVIKVKE